MEKAEPGKRCCKKHLAVRRNDESLRREQRRRDRLCTTCGRPVEGKYKMHARSECVPSRRRWSE